MTTRQRRYRTRQRDAVLAYLAKHSDRYLGVDDVWSGIAVDGAQVGRTTVYRCLEALTNDGSTLKACLPGGEARYRLVGESGAGQLVCLSCGEALTLDCHMALDFSAHVWEHHGFRIDPSRTVLYGLCATCAEDSR